jgi:hypothetical protein
MGLANHTANHCAAQEAYMRPEKATAIVAGRSVATRVEGQWSITGQAARLDRIARIVACDKASSDFLGPPI